MKLTLDGLSNEDMRSRLKTIVKEKSYRYGDEMTLASGKKSRHYFNMKPTMLDPDGALLIANLMLDEVKNLGQKFDAIGGLELGAVPIASAIAPVSALRGEPINAFIIRKKAKDHGTQSLVEGLKDDQTLSGKSIIIVEDVTTTGGSAIKAIEAVRKDGATVAHVITILDREEGAKEAFEEVGITLISLLKKSDFVTAGMSGQ
ncbi:MAG: orotate phosphoribosyltransferase [Rhodomicrobium sp.]|nr:MAG: orotate phosphoribosyltransferase [Rhodomicrobium sp.]